MYYLLPGLAIKKAAKSDNFQDKYICRRCKLDQKEPRQFNFENDMVPCEVSM